MSLLITITNAPDLAALAESSKTFEMQGGSIGRGKDNSWVLDDPERFLSSRHCQLSSENGLFYLTDLSTNGTFYNGSTNPMGKGTKVSLNDGDTFVIGDYEFTVSLWNPVQQSVQQNDPMSAGPFFADVNISSPQRDNDDLFQSAPVEQNGFGFNSEFGGSPFGGGHVSSADSLLSISAEETDPLAALDKAQGGHSRKTNDVLGGFTAGDDRFLSGPTHSDMSEPLNQQISWPSAVPEHDAFSGGAIPDDWDDDLLSPSVPVEQVELPVVKMAQKPVRSFDKAPNPDEIVIDAGDQIHNSTQYDDREVVIATAQQEALEKANAKIQAELEILKQQVNSQSRSPKSEITVNTTLVDAMGFEDRDLIDEEIININQMAGEVMREMVSGLMQVLGSRNSIKNEFRMSVTTIQPVENNPLKFSANVDDALENMFLKQGNAYKRPVEAVRDGFEGIAEHQVAILAGIRAAFKGVIERFDPVLLEARFAKQNKGSLIPGSQKAKNWDSYHEYYNDLAGDIDNSFQYLFGDEFVQAYEDQLQKLAIARKLNKSEK